MTHKFKIIPPIQGVAAVSRTAVSSNDVLFSFKYLVEESYNRCCNSKFFTDLLGRFKKYSTLGWQGIRASGRHQQSLKASGLLRSSSLLVLYATNGITEALVVAVQAHGAG